MNLLLLTANPSPYYMLAFVGIVLIVLELFLPGGIVGAIGTIILVFSLMVMTNTFAAFFISLLCILLLLALVIYALLKIIPKEKIQSSLFLYSSLNKSAGYSASKEKNKYIGCIGITTTILKPIGKIKLGDEVLDAYASANYIEEGKIVEVIKIDGNNNIVVQERKGE